MRGDVKAPDCKSSKNKKFERKLEKKMQKLISFLLFMFAVPKHIARKLVTKKIYILQKTFINFKQNESSTELRDFALEISQI